MATVTTQSGRTVETVTITRDTVLGYSFLSEPEAGFTYPPMGGEPWEADALSEPLVTAPVPDIIQIFDAMDRSPDVVYRTIWVRGEEIGWTRMPGANALVEFVLRPMAKRKKKEWPVEIWRLTDTR